MQIYAPQQVASQFKSRYNRDFGQADIDKFKQVSGWSGQGDITQDQMNKGAAAFDQQYGSGQQQQQQPKPAQQQAGGFTSYLDQTRGGDSTYTYRSAPRQPQQPSGGFQGSSFTQQTLGPESLRGSEQPQQQQTPSFRTNLGPESLNRQPGGPQGVAGFQQWAQGQFGQQATPAQLQQIAQAAGIMDPNNITPEQMQRARQVTQQYAQSQQQGQQQQPKPQLFNQGSSENFYSQPGARRQQLQQQQPGQQQQQQTAPTTQPGLATTPTSVNQFQRWMQSTYNTTATPAQLQQIAEQVGITDPNNITPEQMQRAQAAMASLQQQQGNLGAMPMPALPAQPGPAQSFGESVQQGRNLITPYQQTAGQQQFQQQAQNAVSGVMGQPQMQFQAPQSGPTPDFNQQQQLINQMQQVRGPQSNQALFNQQQQSINAMQGMQAGQFQAQGGQLLGQAAGAAGQLMGAGPLVGQFQAPQQIAQADRNRTLQTIMGSPDVFGQTQQAQMAEQQKEQLVAQQKEAEARLGQLMAQRGMSGRGGAELGAQMGLQENLISGLLAGQRDIALRSAEANRAAQLGAVQAVTGAQQADLGMATQAFQTGLQGAEANRQAQQQATALGAQIAGQQFGQGLQGYQAGLQGQQFNLAAQQAAQQAAGQLGGQQFQQGLAGAEFTRAGQQAALGGLQNLGQMQQAQNQQQFAQGLGAFQANLGAQGQFAQQQLAAAEAANQMGQQGFQNYLAQQGLGLQGIGMAESAAMGRTQNQQQNYQNLLDYLLRARNQEQQYGLDLQGQGLTAQNMAARFAGVG